MFGKNFYFGLTRKFVTVFGTLFNDIVISRPYQDNGDKIQTYKVPLTYGSQSKLLARFNTDANLDRKIAAMTPAMSFLVSAPVYDNERALQSTLQRNYGNSRQFYGVPYNLDFQLFIYADQEEDGLRVLENILPYFTPALTVTVKLVPEMNFNIDVPISLNSVDFDNDSWGQEENRRKLVWTLNFTMKAMFAGPIASGGKVIKRVTVNFRNEDEDPYDTVRVQPGLTANGQPTTDINDTISYHDINATDDFGYITTILGPNDER